MRNCKFGVFSLLLILTLLFISSFSPIPVSAASSSEISFKEVADCRTGFIGKITIRNTGDKEIDQWKLEFDWDREITCIWNARIESHENNHYVITFAEWNKVIPKGKSVTFGFVVRPGMVNNEPSGYKLSDIYDELARKDKEWQDYTAAREAEEMQKSFWDFAMYFGIRFESQNPFTIGYSIMEKDPFKDTVSERYETIYIPTEDGMKLKGAFFPLKDSKGTIIVLHGRTSYAAQTIQPVRFLIQSGYQVLVYNARVWNYYENPKEYVGNVARDIEDVGCAIEYLKARPDVDKDKIGIYGFSYGASKSIAAGSRYKDIKVVLSDAAMSYIGDVYGAERDAAWLLWIKEYFNIPPEQEIPKELYDTIDYTSAIKDIHVPVLILHGLKDDVVPATAANNLYQSANEPKEIYYMPNTGHCNWASTEDKAGYESTVLQFLENNLN
ncbi:MAG: cellulose binding domain-containing protein [Bacillota bacterium]